MQMSADHWRLTHSPTHTHTTAHHELRDNEQPSGEADTAAGHVDKRFLRGVVCHIPEEEVLEDDRLMVGGGRRHGAMKPRHLASDHSFLSYPLRHV